MTESMNSNVSTILNGTGSVSSPANQINEEALIDDKRKIDALQRQVAELKFNSEKVDEKNQKLKQEIDITKQMKDELEKKLAKEKEKREQALTRLSEVAGAKLTENNAAIADLSDIHRPQKLGEMFSEIYDNEWTDAYEELQGRKAYQDCGDDTKVERIATELLEILYTCNKHCSEQAEFLLTNLSDVIRNVGLSKTDKSPLPGSASKKVKDFGKSLGVDLLPRIRELYFNGKNEINSALSRYTAKCLQFCWYAALQDPPVFIGQQKADVDVCYDPNIFREFTKKGQIVDFFVWPILYLHEGGALLAKGVVQCKEKGDTLKAKGNTQQKEQNDVVVPTTKKEKQQLSTSNTSELTPKTAANSTNKMKQNAKESHQSDRPDMTSTITSPAAAAAPPSQTLHNSNLHGAANDGQTGRHTKSLQLPTGQNIQPRKDNGTMIQNDTKEAQVRKRSLNNTNNQHVSVINVSKSGTVEQQDRDSGEIKLKSNENEVPGYVNISKVHGKK